MGNTVLIDFYETNMSPKTIKYEVIIGYGQEAKGTVYIDGVEIRQTTNSFEIDLGSNKDLRGKTLKCIQTIQDIREETNITCMLNIITGGPNDYREVLNEEAKENVGLVSYYCEIYFI